MYMHIQAYTHTHTHLSVNVHLQRVYTVAPPTIITIIIIMSLLPSFLPPSLPPSLSVIAISHYFLNYIWILLIKDCKYPILKWINK